MYIYRQCSSAFSYIHTDTAPELNQHTYDGPPYEDYQDASQEERCAFQLVSLKEELVGPLQSDDEYYPSHERDLGKGRQHEYTIYRLDMEVEVSQENRYRVNQVHVSID